MTLRSLEKLGYLRRIYKGRSSFSQIWPNKIASFKSEILKQWTQTYQFDRNKRILLYDPKGDFLPRFHKFMKANEKTEYALTLFTGASQISPYVLNQTLTLYVNISKRILMDFVNTFKNSINRRGKSLSNQDLIEQEFHQTLKLFKDVLDKILVVGGWSLVIKRLKKYYILTMGSKKLY